MLQQPRSQVETNRQTLSHEDMIHKLHFESFVMLATGAKENDTKSVDVWENKYADAFRFVYHHILGDETIDLISSEAYKNNPGTFFEVIGEEVLGKKELFFSSDDAVKNNFFEKFMELIKLVKESLKEKSIA